MAERDERSASVRQREHADHARWSAEHASWIEEAAEWLRAVDEDAAALRRLADRLEGPERAAIEAHLAAIRRHEAAIAQHEIVLASLDRSGCAGCQPLSAAPHEEGTHPREATAHDRLASRRGRARRLVRALGALFRAPAEESG